MSCERFPSSARPEHTPRGVLEQEAARGRTATATAVALRQKALEFREAMRATQPSGETGRPMPEAVGFSDPDDPESSNELKAKTLEKTANDLTAIGSATIYDKQENIGGFAQVGNSGSRQINVGTHVTETKAGESLIDKKQLMVTDSHERAHERAEAARVQELRIGNVSKDVKATIKEGLEKQGHVVLDTQQTRGKDKTDLELTLDEARAMQDSRSEEGTIGNVSADYKSMLAHAEQELRPDEIQRATQGATTYILAA